MRQAASYGLAPLILSQPKPVTVNKSQSAILEVKAAAVPKAQYQWYRDGKAIKGATQAVYKIAKAKSKDAAEYSVEVKNSSGCMKSQPVLVNVLRSTLREGERFACLRHDQGDNVLFAFICG